MSPTRQWPAGTPAVVYELEMVRKKGAQFFQRPGLVTALSELRRIGQKLYREISVDGGLFPLLRRLIGQAIDHLTPDEDRDAAYALFALDSTGTISLAKRQQYAADCYPKHAGVTANVFRQKLEQGLILRLAGLIDDLESGRIQPYTRQPDLTVSQPSHVPRPEIESWLHALRGNGETLYFIRGDAGTGKSHVARVFAHELPAANDGVVEISAETRSVAIGCIARELDRRGIDSSGHEAVLIEKFKDLLDMSNPKAPGVVLLDNCEDPELFADIMPGKHHSVVLVTSRFDLLKGDQGSSVTVGNMTHDEAFAMIESRLPKLSGRDTYRLAHRLDCRPLAIEHACGFLLQEPDLSIDQFCRLLDKSIAAALDTLVDEEPTLTAIYRLTIGRLGERTLAMLDHLLIANNTSVSYEFLKTVWGARRVLSYTVDEVSIADFELKQELRRLARRSLIEFQDSISVKYSGGGRSEPAFVRINSLTREIFRDLRAFERQSIHSRILALAERKSEFEGWQPGKTLPTRLSRQAPAFRAVLTELVDMSSEMPQFPHLAMLAAFVVRGESHCRANPRDVLRPALRVVEVYGRMIEHSNNVENADLSTSIISTDSYDAVRRVDEVLALRAELRHRFSLFPVNILPPDVGMYVRFGLWDPDFRVQRVPLIHANEWLLAWATPQQFAWSLRKLALTSDSRGTPTVSAWHYFCLGSFYFDAACYVASGVNYKRAYNIWSAQADSGAYIGEICKAGVRIADVYRRLGDRAEAEKWRMETIQHVNKHLIDHGLIEWTEDPFANFALYRAVWSMRRGESAQKSKASSYTKYFGSKAGSLIDIVDGSTATIIGLMRRYDDLYNERTGNLVESARKLAELAAELSGFDWTFPKMLCQIAATKLGIIHFHETGASISGSAKIVQDMNLLALTLQRRMMNPYWALEAHVVAYILAVRYFPDGNESLAKKSMNEIAKLSRVLNRYDRFKLAKQALSHTFNPRLLLRE